MRQSVHDSSQPSGAPTTTAPSPPIAITTPLSKGMRDSGNQIDKAWMAAPRQTDTPTPIIRRPAASAAMLVAEANTSAPATATSSNAASVRRGPKRSSISPAGNWAQANPRK